MSGHQGNGDCGSFVLVPLGALIEAPVNSELYRPVHADDPEVVRLAEAIGWTKIIDPFVVSTDFHIASGHRRKVACRVRGMDDAERVWARILPCASTDPDFPKYVAYFNSQWVKSVDEQVREQVVLTSLDAAAELEQHLEKQFLASFRRGVQAGLREVADKPAPRRSKVSDDKRGMLDAAVAVLQQYKDFWPLTLRQVHYRLVHCHVLRNTRTGLAYVNNRDSYSDLSDLLTRARLAGLVEWESMFDPTRPRTDWRTWPNAGQFVAEELDGLLVGYRRNLLQSQPAYIELVAEKITAQAICERAALPFHCPVGVGRGYTSTANLDDTAQRFHESGKKHMIMLIVGDFDTEGEDIAATWKACLE